MNGELQDLARIFVALYLVIVPTVIVAGLVWGMIDEWRERRARERILGRRRKQ